MGPARLQLTSFPHPLAWPAETVGPTLGTVVPILSHAEVALVTAAHSVHCAGALLPCHQAHSWGSREGAESSSKDGYGGGEYPVTGGNLAEGWTAASAGLGAPAWDLQSALGDKTPASCAALVCVCLGPCEVHPQIS